MNRIYGRLVGDRAHAWETSSGVMCLLCLGGMTLVVANAFGQTNEAGNPKIKVGDYAPDFELPRLTITADPNDRPIGVINESNTIRLSSFRGKKPVCLIMSSYT